MLTDSGNHEPMLTRAWQLATGHPSGAAAVHLSPALATDYWKLIQFSVFSTQQQPSLQFHNNNKTIDNFLFSNCRPRLHCDWYAGMVTNIMQPSSSLEYSLQASSLLLSLTSCIFFQRWFFLQFWFWHRILIFLLKSVSTKAHHFLDFVISWNINKFLWVKKLWSEFVYLRLRKSHK